MDILNNLRTVQQRIAAAQQRSTRAAEEVMLLAVSKTKPIEMICEAYQLGQTAFGENRVQELLEKYETLPDAKWHLIGHLQKNKVKYLVGKTCLIHSLDSIDLAKEIEKRSAAQELVTDCLVQVNIAREDTKSGLYEEELYDFIAEMQKYPHVRIKGLMTIGPHVEEEAAIRNVFRTLRQHYDVLKEKSLPHTDIQWLSMGMTYDYEIAVEEGANIVRVGSGIFGERDYSLQEKL